MIRVILLFLLFSIETAAQDIHFSQYFRQPLLFNPALTGNIGYCLIRAGAGYRSQWEKTYITKSAFADGRISPGGLDAFTHFGLGAAFYSDIAGDGNMKDNYGMLSMAIHKSFNGFGTVIGSIGISAAIGSVLIDYSRLYFDSQWNGFRFDNSLPDNENFKQSSFSYFDLNMGGKLLLKSRRNHSGLEIGFSVFHIMEPEYSFFSSGVRLKRRYSVHTGSFIYSGKSVFSPAFYFSLQDKAYEALAGMNISYRVKELEMIYGVWFRIVQAVVPVAGLEYKGLSIMFSYDINVAGGIPALSSGIEISLIKRFCYSSRKLYDKMTAPCDR